MGSERALLHQSTRLLDSTADRLTAFAGSWAFLGLHLCWFSVWIVLRFEPFPFGLLTMIVSLEAIFLSTLVMMSQNRSADRDRRRDDIESAEVQAIYDSHELLLRINQQQLEILTALREGKH